MATVLPERQTTQRAILNIIENDVVPFLPVLSVPNLKRFVASMDTKFAFDYS